MSERSSEQMWMELMDRWEEQEARRRMADIPLSEPAKVDHAALQRIQTSTFAKLGLPALPDRTRPRRLARVRARWIAAAGLALVVLLIVLAVGAPDARAQLRKVLQFLPGFGMVENSQTMQLNYSLDHPVIRSVEGGQLEIRGLSIGPTRSFAALTGTAGVEQVERFVLRNGEGGEYTLHYGALSNSGDWGGDYYFEGSVKVTDKMELVFTMDGQEIDVPISLVQVQRVDRVEQLGTTDTHQGISLTAVVRPSGTDGQTAVTLVPQLPENVQITGYGFSRMHHLAQPVLQDKDGKSVAVQQSEVFPNPNEFTFQSGDAGPDGYKLIIPELSLTRRPAEPLSFEVPIPREGTQELNRTVDLLGFPFVLESVERMPNSPDQPGRAVVQLKVRIPDRPGSAEAMREFLPNGMKNRDLPGFGFRVDEQTQAMKELDLSVPLGLSSYRIYVGEVYTVERGPWVLPLLADSR